MEDIKKKIFFFAMLFSLCSCSLDFSLIKGSSSAGSDSDAFQKTSLASGSFVDLFGVSRNFELIKTQTGSAMPTFVQWIPNAAQTPSGTVLIYLPEEGIAWTGLKLDFDWAARGTGVYSDVNGPFYDAATSSPIYYSEASTTNSAAEGFPYSVNDLNVLIVFGRFYAGGDFQQDMNNIKNGLKFLQAQSLVQSDRVGFYGSYWGSAALLYAVTQADSALRPKAISLLSPVSDIKLVHELFTVTIPTQAPAQAAVYGSLADPYLRRIDKTTEGLVGSATRYDAFKQSALTSLTSDIFVAHDDWDTLVPSAQSASLLSSISSSRKKSYYHRHGSPVDYTTFSANHSQATEVMNNEAALVWNRIFLLNSLIESSKPRMALYRASLVIDQIQYVIARFNAGLDTSFFNSLLAELCVPNLNMHDLDGSYPDMDGATILSALMNANYQAGWSTGPADACAKLTTTPPF